MNKKQKRGLVAKTSASTENKQAYFSLDISNEKIDLSHLQWGWHLISNWNCTFWHLLYNAGEDKGQREGSLLMLNDHILTTWHCCAWGGAELWTHHWCWWAWAAFCPPERYQQCGRAVPTIIWLCTSSSQMATGSAASPQMTANASMLLWNGIKVQNGRDLWDPLLLWHPLIHFLPQGDWGKPLHASCRTRGPGCLYLSMDPNKGWPYFLFYYNLAKIMCSIMQPAVCPSYMLSPAKHCCHGTPLLPCAAQESRCLLASAVCTGRKASS